MAPTVNDCEFISVIVMWARSVLPFRAAYGRHDVL